MMFFLFVFFPLTLGLLCLTVPFRSHVSRGILSVILLHSINKKACLQKTMPADDSMSVERLFGS